MLNFRRCIAVLAMGLVVSGCSNVRSQLGFSRNSPDEFTVVKRAPLSVPPSYNLRPPGSATPATMQQEATERARSAVFGEGGVQPGPSVPAATGEAALLSEAGAVDADPAIRDVLDQEAGYINLGEKTVVDKVIFWKDLKTEDDEFLVDPAAERERLKENQEEGKPLNEGDVPTIEKRKKIDLF